MWFLFVWFAHSTGEFVGSFENPNLQSAYEPPWWNDSKPGQSRRTGRVVVRIVAERRRSMKVPHSIHFETLKTHGVCVCDCHPVLWRVNSKQRYDEYGWMGIGPNCCPGASQTPNFLLALWNLSTEKVCLAKGSTCWLYCRGSDAFKLRGALPKVKWWTVWDTLVNAGLMSRSFDFPTSKGLQDQEIEDGEILGHDDYPNDFLTARKIIMQHLSASAHTITRLGSNILRLEV